MMIKKGNQMTKAELRAESDKLIREFLARGGVVEHGKDRKTPKTRTANAKFKGGRVNSDPTFQSLSRAI